MCFEPGERCCGVLEGLVALSANVVYQFPTRNCVRLVIFDILCRRNQQRHSHIFGSTAEFLQCMICNQSCHPGINYSRTTTGTE